MNVNSIRGQINRLNSKRMAASNNASNVYHGLPFYNITKLKHKRCCNKWARRYGRLSVKLTQLFGRLDAFNFKMQILHQFE